MTNYDLFLCALVANAIRSLRPFRPSVSRRVPSSRTPVHRSDRKSLQINELRKQGEGFPYEIVRKRPSSCTLQVLVFRLPTSVLQSPASAYVHLHLLAPTCRKNCANQCSRRSSDPGFPLLPLRAPVQKSAFSGSPALLFDSCAPRHE